MINAWILKLVANYVVFFNLLQYHPGTNITFIDDFEHSSSLRPLWIQVRAIHKRMAGIMAEHPEGVHLVCFSQGDKS